MRLRRCAVTHRRETRWPDGAWQSAPHPGDPSNTTTWQVRYPYAHERNVDAPGSLAHRALTPPVVPGRRGRARVTEHRRSPGLGVAPREARDARRGTTVARGSARPHDPEVDHVVVGVRVLQALCELRVCERRDRDLHPHPAFRCRSFGWNSESRDGLTLLMTVAVADSAAPGPSAVSGMVSSAMEDPPE
jgi:hypothetical protein